MAASTYERINALNRKTAKRYAKLSGAALTEATTFIDRYLNACRKVGVEVDLSTIHEILNTAANDRLYFKRLPG